MGIELSFEGVRLVSFFKGVIKGEFSFFIRKGGTFLCGFALDSAGSDSELESTIVSVAWSSLVIVWSLIAVFTTVLADFWSSLVTCWSFANL